MRSMGILSLVVMLLFVTGGCAPDLTVKKLKVTWDGTNRKAEAEIANIGTKDAGKFMVYFNGDENPVSANHRPQVRQEVQGLARGAFITLYADFARLAHPDNNNLGNVYKITVMVDPKGMVRESNEENNNKDAPIPTAPVVSPYNLISAGNSVVDNTQWVSQTFTATQTAQLVGIEVAAVCCQATGTDALTLEIGQGALSLGSASIMGAVLPGPGQCGVVPPALQLNVQGPGYFALSSLNINLVQGNTYYFKLMSPTNRDFRVGVSTDLYSGGSASVNGSATSKDLAFKIVTSP